MKTLNWMVAIALVAIAAGTANASTPREYVGSTDILTVYDGDPSDGVDPGVGGGAFQAGEIVGDAEGKATVTIADDVFPAVGGIYCQDYNDDSVCGDDGTLGVVEPFAFFCISQVIKDTTFGAPDATLGEAAWDTLFAVVIFLDGPVFGNPVTGGCLTEAFGTHGFITTT